MKRILIVEDEVLIAESIERYLLAEGYAVVGIALSYEEAMDCLERTPVDLVLLDIRLDGAKTGIDLAHQIRQRWSSLPFIFLTAQLDKNTLDQAKDCFPAGYLAKPIQKGSLLATMTIALHQSRQEKEDWITVSDGAEHHRLRQSDILYLEADHIYVNIYLKDRELPIVVRQPLRYFQQMLSADLFLQANRSYLVNRQHIHSWDKQQVWVLKQAIKISRSQKEAVLQALSEGNK